MQSIKVKDKTYSFCWGTGALMDTCDKLDCTVTDITAGVFADTDKYLVNLAYSALLNHDKTANFGENIIIGKDGEQLDGFSFRQFLVWLDNEPQEVGNMIAESFMNSVYSGRTMRERYEQIAEKMRVDLDNDEISPVKKKKERLPK